MTTTTTTTPARVALALRLLDEVISPNGFQLVDSQTAQLAMIEETARLLGDFADLASQERQDLCSDGVRGIANTIAQSFKIAQILAEAIHAEHREVTCPTADPVPAKAAKIASDLTGKPVLPKPTPSASRPYRVTIELSAAEWNCLQVLAERWGTIPEYAASTVLLMSLSDRYDRDQGKVQA